MVRVDWWYTDELAKESGVSSELIALYCREGHLEGMKVKGVWFIFPKSAARWIAECKEGGGVMGISYRDLCGPDPSPMTLKEAEALRLVCAWLPNKPVIIQIGAEHGASTVAMLEKKPGAFIFSIDVGAREGERQNLERANIDWRLVVRGLGHSQDIGHWWPRDWQCDLLYIDGDHERPGIDDDIKLWTKAVKPGGYLALHDYMLPEDRGPRIKGRVYEAVQEWRETDEDFEEVLWVEMLVAYKRR